MVCRETQGFIATILATQVPKENTVTAARLLASTIESDWQTQLREAVTQTDHLLSLLELPTHLSLACNAAANDFSVKVPHSFIARMRPGDPRDPLLLQVLARREETLSTPGYSHDPVNEMHSSATPPGMLHKYHGRVLMILTGGCAIHCRYCFRRHFPYDDHRNSREEWSQALDYLLRNDSIEEVILSGGDPLLVTDKQLKRLVHDLAAIPHIKRLRIHSRLPIVIPARITASLLEAIAHESLQTVMVLHSNHANEINTAVAQAVRKLRGDGIHVLNQAVLLADINNTVDAQVSLSKALFEAGVLPYYLHVLDKVTGAAHFDMPEAEALTLHATMREQLPGYLVPKLVREIGGEPAKTPVELL